MNVGYLVHKAEGPEGAPGLFYNYIVAENGLFLEARGPYLELRILISPAVVRGLSPLQEMAKLIKGRIPYRLYELAISILAADPHLERYLAITWEGEYRLRLPHQEGRAAGVSYECLPNTVLDIHSHGTMGAFFSSTDDRDEQGLRLYMVAGKLHSMFPDIEIRAGAYGYFSPLNLREVFDV